MMKDDDFKLLKGFALGRTDGQTFAIVESLSRLKIGTGTENMQVACVWHTENMQKLEPNPDQTSQLSLTYKHHFNALLKQQAW